MTLLNLLLQQHEGWEHLSCWAAHPLTITHTCLPPHCFWTQRKLASAREGLHGPSCQGEGATELLHAKQKSLN